VNHLPLSARPTLPFLLAGVLFLFSVWPHLVQGRKAVVHCVGLWVPSIHSLRTLLLSPVDARAGARVRSEF
jgi:hypothetical protein